MRIDWWTLALQTINALILIWLLARFLFKPVAAIIAERKALAARLIEDAEAVKTTALKLDQEAEARLAEIAARRNAALVAAAKEAEAEKAALVAAAHVEIEKMRAAAEAKIERERAAGLRAQAEDARRLAVEIARRLFERLPPDAQIAGFTEGVAKALAALPDTTRAEFAKPNAVLRAPRALTDAENETLRGVLEKALGRSVDFSVEVDPSLIAGLELENAHVSLCNSFRADLNEIAARLRQDRARG
jgi:F-type H+-transporting ATPase subunit b